MIYQEQDGQTVVLDGNHLAVNGITHELPKSIQNRNGHNLTQVDNKLYIDGYEFKNGKFRRSIAALFYFFF